MQKIFTKYRLEMVKEEAHKYTVDTKVDGPENMYQILTLVGKLDIQCEEVLMLITLNTKNIVTGIFEVHRGSINSSIVHPREVYKRALLANASNIIVAHNHPSGDPNPSKEDINITERLREAGKMLGIELLDHIIVGDGSYISLKTKGII